ncbi:hypothetical protein HHK36_010183 [Tetracentron sinense]|uniref:Uncharacterized protein n=1 Tax=Tetracentron sinense TaxID=13715 RepID=A0A834ZEJ0_TETSI|nr:hypothetical protein HHK36_010183 [Tetracentron sinense]
MFTSQLVESAKDELSFRTVVRDLRTRSPMLQIVLQNPNAWCCTGYCFGTEGITGPVSKIDLHPVAKVLFSDFSDAAETQFRYFGAKEANHHLELSAVEHLISNALHVILFKENKT